MEDTQKKPIKKTFAIRRRNTVIGMILMIPSGFLAGFGIAAVAEGIAILGIPAYIWTPASLIVFAGSIIFCAVNWRCPSCGTGLPIYANPLRCKACNTELQ